MKVMLWLFNPNRIISVCLKHAESISSNKWDSTANTQVKSHLSARRSKLQDPFTNFVSVSGRPHEPCEIDYSKQLMELGFKKSGTIVFNQKCV